MKTSITTFPSGGAEGLPVVRLDAEGLPWSTDDARAALARALPRGLFAVWLDGVADWTDRDLLAWVNAKPDVEHLGLVAVRPLGASDWLGHGVSWVLDASEAFREASTIDELADYLALQAHAFPVIEDLVVTLEAGSMAPPASFLDAVYDHVQPECQAYLYAPRDHRHWPLLERAVATCSSMWALRGAHDSQA